jgi:protein TonB
VIPTASKVAPPPEPVATPPPEEVAAEEPGIGGPASYGDDTTGGTIGVGVSNTKGDDYDRSITENWQPLEKLQPEYPQQARLDGIEGYVKFLVDISEEGRVENVELVEASPRGVFERNARKAVLKWKYSPPKKDGRPFRLKGHSITISFSLNEE